MPCEHFIFHGHGTWMPDEDDGYVKRKNGHLPPDARAAAQHRQAMHGDVVLFEEPQQLALIDEVHVAARHQAFRVHFVATEPTRIHVLVNWHDARPFEKLRRGIWQSLSRRLSREFGQRQWLSEGGSRRRIGNQDHFDYLVGAYLPGQGGWKWSEERGLHRESMPPGDSPAPGLVPARNMRVLLLLAAFSRYPEALDWAGQTAEAAWGPVALASERFEHRETHYYEPTMGPDLQKCFFAFATLVDPAELVECKVTSNRWEAEYQQLGRHPEPRPLNLDPGYLTEAKLVLATTKDRDHRIYLDRGIFAEVTLHFQKGAWQARPWTYPDYRRADYHAFFTRCREFLRGQSGAIA